MTCPLPPARWWQDYVAGLLRTPRAIFRAALAEKPDPAQSGDRVFEIPDPGPTFSAPERLKAPLHMISEAYQRQLHVADWTHADPRLIVWAAIFQQMARKRDIPLYAHSCLRPKSVQDSLVRSGVTKAAYPRSAHNIGEAVDIVHGTYHWQLNKQEWELLHVLGRLALDRCNTYVKAANKLSLTWGGSFKTIYDPAHWEISDYRKRIRPLPDNPSPLRLTPHEVLSKRDLYLRGL